MEKDIKNNYYGVEDEAHFEKLNNFRKFNTKNRLDTPNKNHEIKYSNSDKNLFNNIIKTQENSSILNETDIKKDINYYNSSDHKKFEKLDNFPEYNSENNHNKLNLNSNISYTSSDYGQFEKIIKTNPEEMNADQYSNKKVKIIDFDKIREKEKKIKNKIGIDKIKIVYFD